MQVTIKNGFVENWSENGFFVDGIEVDMPDDFGDFFINSAAYKIENGRLIKDNDELNKINDSNNINEIRKRRSSECFPIINRGELWYSLLTEDQIEELRVWYMAWLDAPQTKIIPEQPDWIN